MKMKFGFVFVSSRGKRIYDKWNDIYKYSFREVCKSIDIHLIEATI